jgi:hypothetical protein
VLRAGTLNDRVAAMVLLVQEGPMYRVRQLDALIAMAAKKGRREGKEPPTPPYRCRRWLIRLCGV